MSRSVVVDPSTIGPRDVLALRVRGLGGALTAVAALRALRRTADDHRLVFAGGLEVGRLLAQHGVVDAVLPVRELGPLPAMAGGHLAVDLHGRGAAGRAVLRATAPRAVVGFSYPCAQEPGPAWRPREHEVLRWCRLVATMGGQATLEDMRLRPRAGPDAGPPARREGGRTVIIHPGASSGARRWGAARWAAVARHLVEDGHHVVLTGGATERRLCAQIEESVGRPLRERVANICARLALDRFAAAVAKACLVLSSDTGVAHLATALAVPSVTLYGPTPPASCGPIIDHDLHAVLWVGQGHEHGDRHGLVIDPRLDAIGVATVVNAARERLAGCTGHVPAPREAATTSPAVTSHPKATPPPKVTLAAPDRRAASAGIPQARMASHL